MMQAVIGAVSASQPQDTKNSPTASLPMLDSKEQFLRYTEATILSLQEFKEALPLPIGIDGEYRAHTKSLNAHTKRLNPSNRC